MGDERDGDGERGRERGTSRDGGGRDRDRDRGSREVEFRSLFPPANSELIHGCSEMQMQVPTVYVRNLNRRCEYRHLLLISLSFDLL